MKSRLVFIKHQLLLLMTWTRGEIKPFNDCFATAAATMFHQTKLKFFQKYRLHPHFHKRGEIKPFKLQELIVLICPNLCLAARTMFQTTAKNLIDHNHLCPHKNHKIFLQEIFQPKNQASKLSHFSVYNPRVGLGPPERDRGRQILVKNLDNKDVNVKPGFCLANPRVFG